MRDKIRNKQIREEFNTKSTLEYFKERQMSWWGHMKRMNEKIPVKIYRKLAYKQREIKEELKTTEILMARKIIFKRRMILKEAGALTKDR